MTLRHRYEAARAADPAEFEQAKLRLAMLVLIELYFAGAFAWDGVVARTEWGVLAFLAGVFVAGAALFAWIVAAPGLNHARRGLGMVLDIGAVTAFIPAAGEAGALLAGLFLWIPIGNGFRFGRRYLHVAQAMALGGLAVVLWWSEFWQEHITFGLAFGVALLAVPWYVSLLIGRMQEARREAEAANVAKTKFLAAASHDLRQPMQALSMYATVLDERVRDADAARVVHGIQLSVTTLERMFDSLLDIAKIESGVIQPSVVAFALMPLIQRVVETEQPIAVRKGLELRAMPTSVTVSSDPALLERMLKNLVTNAIRYTERGRIVIGCRRLAASRVRLEVIDSGIGIAPDEQVRIFNEYYQITGASAQGLGLGLPIVKSLGELLGHEVRVRSAPGRGSVFSIELARAVAPAAAGEITPLHTQLRGLNVALVDDDVEIRSSMGLLLDGWGCRTVAAASVAEVERKLQDARITPDAVIADYRLADATTGPEVIERLRATFGRQLPALIITGTANPAATAGIPLIMKPVAPGRLRAFLTQVQRRAT